MTDPIDLSQFREITDGDEEFEAEMFALFVETAEGCIAALENAIGQDNDQWKASSHELKGASLNLGANRLAELCFQGQEGAFNMPDDTKQQLANDIRNEFEVVQRYYNENK